MSKAVDDVIRELVEKDNISTRGFRELVFMSEEFKLIITEERLADASFMANVRKRINKVSILH